MVDMGLGCMKREGEGLTSLNPVNASLLLTNLLKESPGLLAFPLKGGG